MRKTTLLLLLTLAACSHEVPPVAEAPLPPLAKWEPSLHLADTSLAGGAPGIALQVADELLAVHPDDADALTRRGEALAALGRPEDAETAYREALTAAPTHVRALLALGRLRLPKNAAEAESIFAQIDAIDPHNAAALNDLGVARDLQGHHTGAQEAYRKALAAQPTSSSAQINLGLSLALSGDANGAIAVLRPLATESSASPLVRDDFAFALALSGNVAEASSMLSKDLNPQDVRRALAGFHALQP
jgi:Flp pilus assembly protein TadD